MIKRVLDASVEYTQIMDENGSVDQSLMPKDVNDAKILEMYKTMSFARALDAKILSLQRQGRAVTYAPLVGQEGTQVGCAAAMGPYDFLVPNFRQHAVFLARGMPLDAIILGWRGYEESIPAEARTLPSCVPVATQMPHAAGVAYAMKYNKVNGAVVAWVGDGGTSEGDFYEAINFAGAKKVPMVTIIENNGWAISVPRAQQTAAPTLAQKAIAAGLSGAQVDGNDVIAVYKIVKDAIAKAVQGQPSVIECLTYRMSMHTTADDPTKYRPPEDVIAWQARDPILRVRKYLTARGQWDESKQNAMEEEQLGKINAAVAVAEKFVPDPKSMFEHTYSFIPEILNDELQDALNANWWMQQKGDGGE